jgi:hypothetical protein
MCEMNASAGPHPGRSDRPSAVVRKRTNSEMCRSGSVCLRLSNPREDGGSLCRSIPTISTSGHADPFASMKERYCGPAVTTEPSSAESNTRTRPLPPVCG